MPRSGERSFDANVQELIRGIGNMKYEHKVQGMVAKGSKLIYPVGRKNISTKAGS